MYQLFRPSALSMEMIFTVGLFIFCTSKMYQGKVECKTQVGDSFRYYSNALSLDVLVFQVLYFIAPYYVLIILYPTPILCRCIGVGFLASYLVRRRPSPSGDGYTTLVPTSRRSFIIFFHLLFLYREGSSSLDFLLGKVPRSLRGDECYKPTNYMNIPQLNFFRDSPRIYPSQL